MNTKTNYQTWIRMNKLLIFLGISLLLLLITLYSVQVYFRVLAGMLALPFLYITFILSYSVYQFSTFGGGFQSKIHHLIVSKVEDGSGKILDIGTGSGSLIIKLAKAFPNSTLTGIDFWGENWEYSKAQCEQNAEIEGVSDRIHFVKASASHLPFQNGEFDVVVSCLTFHEVKDSKNKTEVIKEALRLVKPGGTFVFMDLFMDESTFGKKTELVADLTKHGEIELNDDKLTDILPLPKILRNKKVLGNAMVLSGKKANKAQSR
ncbi:class I SAM-dependent methyltransferase [Rossellomorea aquimaris]|uniref:Class I SAM-dependent methyltransferase n=1 Tax=Rossellomorea aquimaris TaxID=189382 RepID=A0A5D4U2M6_9BACI|nr:class I SAM-dependent methyltransferase [Rossellomorea aquimaris]TYS81574.1 class I SAM-dependent methyltransferase [Rossellomorea aquimaris]TYS88197.1 class I SAM-dependent methyltransferase [Rossellomorea aquimaris]